MPPLAPTNQAPTQHVLANLHLPKPTHTHLCLPSRNSLLCARPGRGRAGLAPPAPALTAPPPAGMAYGAAWESGHGSEASCGPGRVSRSGTCSDSTTACRAKQASGRVAGRSRGDAHARCVRCRHTNHQLPPAPAPHLLQLSAHQLWRALSKGRSQLGHVTRQRVAGAREEDKGRRGGGCGAERHVRRVTPDAPPLQALLRRLPSP